jgi:hypothetical protein
MNGTMHSKRYDDDDEFGWILDAYNTKVLDSAPFGWIAF